MNRKFKFYLPNIWESLLIVGIFLCIGSLFASILLIAYSKLSGTSLTNMLNYNLLVIYIIPMVPVFCYIILRSYLLAKQNGEYIKIHKPVKMEEGRKLSWLSISIVVLLSVLALGFAIDPITAHIDIPEGLKPTYGKMSSGDIWSLLSVVIFAPLCEEFIFRGNIERGMLKKGSPAIAIIWSSFLFGFIHLNLFQGLAGFIMGAFIGYIYYKTHSIWLAIFAHFVNNGSSFLLVYLLPKELATMNTSQVLNYFNITNNIYWTIVALGALICILSIFTIEKSFPKNNHFRK